MKDIIFVFFLLLLSACMQSGYQTGYIISDSTKEVKETSPIEKPEMPR